MKSAEPSATEQPATRPADILPDQGSRWVPVWVFLGLLLMQAAWVISVPPFRAIDEFDHVFRAASVALGDFRPDHGLPDDGRGALIIVPREIALAAHEQCASLEYTGRDDCTPVKDLAGDRVLISSGAAAYSPVAYWVFGTLAKPFDGVGALYAMRSASCLISAGLIAMAAWCLRRFRTIWPLAGLLVAITPMVTFTSFIPAPNGLEVSAAFLLWCSLLALQRAPSREISMMFVCATLAAGLMAAIRATGPVFILLILGFVIAADPRATSTLVRAHSKLAAGATAVVCLCASTQIWWMFNHGPANSEGKGSGVERDSVEALVRSLVWIFQWIGAFPYRDQAAPSLTYAACGVALSAFFVFAWRQRSRLVFVGVLVVVACVLLPYAYTIATVPDRGYFWQGRYALPLLVGAPILIGLALDRVRAPRSLRDRLFGRLLIALYAVASAAGIIHVLTQESDRTASSADPHWHQPSSVLIAAMVVLATLCFMAAIGRAWHGVSLEPSGPKLTNTEPQPNGTDQQSKSG